MSRFHCGIALWLFCYFALALPSFCHADNSVVIAVNEDIIPDYRLFLRHREPQDVEQYSGLGARRDVIELVLLMQALHLGGFKSPIELHAEQSYLRTLRDIAEGQSITSAGLAWKADIDIMQDAYFTSRALIKDGEFVVGLYTTRTNQLALSQLSNAQITELNVITNSQWKSDVQTLKTLGFKHITYSPNWVNIARMIEANRADVTLAPFQSSVDMSIPVGDISLYPVPGVKVVIPGSRHWPISRKHPQGKAFFDALERGLAQLEAQGTIQRAYRECGFFNPESAQWRLLSAAEPTPDKH